MDAEVVVEEEEDIEVPELVGVTDEVESASVIEVVRMSTLDDVCVTADATVLRALLLFTSASAVSVGVGSSAGVAVTEDAITVGNATK